MAIRPIDIARKLNISTTTLRTYEAFGLIPPVLRTAAGYRDFTEEHLAYFSCIRQMLPGFSLTLIAKILQAVMAKNIDAALWLVNQAQAELQQEQLISEKILNRFHKNLAEISPNHERLTIHEVSQETGIPATTIRYWDKVGLITVERGTQNNYRLFTAKHVRQLLTIYALKAAVQANREQYSIERVKAELQELDDSDNSRILTMATESRQHLDKVNRAQIAGIAALYTLCLQVESNQFTNLLLAE